MLAIDTATSVCSVALAKGGALLGEITTNFPRKHSQRLLPMVETLMGEAGLKPKDLDLLAVTKGPGSFTGLRIGIATVKGMGLALDIPVVGISTLTVLAHNFNEGLVCPVLNARLRQVYSALFRGGGQRPETIISERAIAPEALLASLASYSEPIWFCGDGVAEVYDSAGQKLGEPRMAPSHLQVSRASALADLARFEKPGDLDALVPFYLRDSQAEVQLRRQRSQK